MNDTARPQLDREIATTADGIDITRGYTGPLLTPYDSILRSRGGNDLRIYEEVYSDPEVKSTFGQRQAAVTQCEWQVDAGGDRPIDQEAAEFLRQQLQRIGWDNVTSKMLNGIFYGYAVAELIYKVDGARLVIDQVKVRNRRRFRFAKDAGLRLLTMDQMFEGIPAEAPYFWHFCTGADHDDEPYGLGLAHWLYWPVLFKRNGLKFWLIFLEKFGMPTAVGKYDTTATAPERSRLLQAARALQTDSGIIMPKEMELELIEAGRNGTADYQALHDAMNATIQKVILGQTASTQGTAGRLGNDDLQADVRDDIIKADADLICESFNLGPVRWLMEWNFPGAALPRVFRVTEEPEDLSARAERDKKILDLGYKPSLAYVHEVYGTEWEPKDPAPVDPREPTAIDGAEFAQPARAVLELLQRGHPRARGAAFAEAAAAPDVPARMAPRLERDIKPTGDAWLVQVRELVESSGSLQELSDALMALQPDMDLDAYSAAMADALTAATLAGRYDVLQEAGGA
ncbi:DUF935 domain-containing protein [Luteimonas terricola]|uniref:DUF935 family protein n=1 Tax=Luteimonas terricola TaxID=645597 RepID=A0ABQ2EES8_9GAMM|nr:DUF935 family protein [Luteimonas terricola]GGK08659.1 hypothetical protein GCM10011394_17550 [Luteimonas terricola]